ncbi:MAG: 1-acyl-sn-glycerol-3-phosphate acyltransferase [Blastochloris sp.]|nr:1-acyl-sn-glycerol-3-phosphate acyltransferase [Blastochloris sp.]
MCFTTRVRVEGWEKIPAGPFLLACNHISHFDPPVIGALCPVKLDFMAMADLFQHPVAAFFFKMVDTFPVQRGRPDHQALRVALDRLEKGRRVCVFPEGGLRSGEASVLNGQALKAGTAVMADRAQVPVLPLLILGTDRFYSWSWGRRIPLILLVGEALRVDPSLPEAERREELTGRLEKALRALYEQAQGWPEFTRELVPRTAQERWAEVGR